MKKIILIIVMCFVLVGCELSKEEKAFKDYAIDYYENYMKDIQMDSYQITIKMLKNSNRQKITDYDLSKLENCDDDSYINISIKNNEKNYDYKLNCN